MGEWRHDLVALLAGQNRQLEATQVEFRHLDRQAVRRWGAAQDVVNVVEFFLRPESAMVTGQVIYLGGAG